MSNQKEKTTAQAAGMNRAKPYQLVLFPMNNGATNVYYILTMNFIAKAIELKADALLVSQTVTQKDIHIKNLTELVEMLEAEGLRDKVILACGGPRISHELAKELGYDAGFGMNTYADDVASFIAQELDRRMNH